MGLEPVERYSPVAIEGRLSQNLDPFLTVNASQLSALIDAIDPEGLASPPNALAIF